MNTQACHHIYLHALSAADPSAQIAPLAASSPLAQHFPQYIKLKICGGQPCAIHGLPGSCGHRPEPIRPEHQTHCQRNTILVDGAYV